MGRQLLQEWAAFLRRAGREGEPLDKLGNQLQSTDLIVFLCLCVTACYSACPLMFFNLYLVTAFPRLLLSGHAFSSRMPTLTCIFTGTDVHCAANVSGGAQ